MGGFFSKNHPDDHPNVYPSQNAVLHRNLKLEPPFALSATENTLHVSHGWEDIYNASCGAAVSCLGHKVIPRIVNAMIQAATLFYAPPLTFNTTIANEFMKFLVDSTDGVMVRAWVCNSGSDAVESAIKIARQHFCEKHESKRTKFITRHQSYHGATCGALSLSGHLQRRGIFECFLMDNVSHISACNPYRDRLAGETDAAYIDRKALELENKFIELGPDTVIAFIAEPWVGAALGSAGAPRGYFKAMKKVCRKYGALLIFDEVMCGSGRMGTLHAWQRQEVGVTPDISILGKGLAAGYQPIAAILINRLVEKPILEGTGTFAHGHTFQNHPIVCAAALEVQRIIQENRLLDNVNRMGALLGRLLQQELGDHDHVGDIRGGGLFWSIEFVQDKLTKEPFHISNHVCWKFHEQGLKAPYQIYLYPGSGTKDGVSGDHVTIAPPYDVTEKDIRFIVDRTKKTVHDFFAELNTAVTEKPIV